MLPALIPVVQIQISLMACLCHANVLIDDCHDDFADVVVSINLHRPIKWSNRINAVIVPDTNEVKFEQKITVKNELSIKWEAEGKRKITTRSSSTLEASSGIVSGKANSLGDDTQEL